MENVYCSLSQLKIDEDTPIYFLPIIHRHVVEGGAWHPFCLPIRCRYYYGNFDNIEADQNVKLLEQYFGEDIDTLIAMLVLKQEIGKEYKVQDNILNGGTFGQLSFMIFRADVYDFVAREYYGGGNHIYFGDTHILTNLGANYIGQGVGDKVYLKEIYRYVWELSGKRLYSDKKYLQTEEGEYIGSLNNFFEYTRNGGVYKLLGKTMFDFWDVLNYIQEETYNVLRVFGESTPGTTTEVFKYYDQSKVKFDIFSFCYLYHRGDAFIEVGPALRDLSVFDLNARQIGFKYEPYQVYNHFETDYKVYFALYSHFIKLVGKLD